MEPGKIKLIEHLRKTKLNLLTHSIDNYPYVVAFNYLNAILDKDRNGFIITLPHNIDKLQKMIDENSNGNIFVYPYTDNWHDLEYIRFPDSVIIFDSLYMILGDVDNKNCIDNFKFLLDSLYERFSVVMTIVDSSYDQADINKLAPHFPSNMSYLSDTASSTISEGKLSEPVIIDCKLDRAPITEKQNAIINQVVKNINIDSLNWTNDKLYINNIYKDADDKFQDSPKRFFNVLYPFNVSDTIDKAATVDDGIQLVIDLFGIEEFLNYTPKIRRLYDKLLIADRYCKDDSSVLARHVIFTGYPIYEGKNVRFGEYGGDLIYNVLTYGKNPPYETSQVMRLYEGDPVENMKKFNEDKNYTILIANTMPVYAPQGIHHFHVIDTNMETAFDLIDIMFKNDNYDGKTAYLDIHLHYTYNDKGSGSQMTYDSYDFKNFREYIEKFQQERQLRWDYGYKVYSGSNNLYVKYK